MLPEVKKPEPRLQPIKSVAFTLSIRPIIPRKRRLERKKGTKNAPAVRP